MGIHISSYHNTSCWIWSTDPVNCVKTSSYAGILLQNASSIAHCPGSLSQRWGFSVIIFLEQQWWPFQCYYWQETWNNFLLIHRWFILLQLSDCPDCNSKMETMKSEITPNYWAFSITDPDSLIQRHPHMSGLIKVNGKPEAWLPGTQNRDQCHTHKGQWMIEQSAWISRWYLRIPSVLDCSLRAV